MTEPTATDRKREQARLRQQRRRQRLREQRPAMERNCLCCGAAFAPKRSDSWFCSRRCIDRTSHHRKRIQRKIYGLTLSRIWWEKRGGPEPMTVAQYKENLREREPLLMVWFPDLFDIPADKAAELRAGEDTQAMVHHAGIEHFLNQMAYLSDLERRLVSNIQKRHQKLVLTEPIAKAALDVGLDRIAKAKAQA